MKKEKKNRERGKKDEVELGKKKSENKINGKKERENGRSWRGRE